MGVCSPVGGAHLHIQRVAWLVLLAATCRSCPATRRAASAPPARARRRLGAGLTGARRRGPGRPSRRPMAEGQGGGRACRGGWRGMDRARRVRRMVALLIDGSDGIGTAICAGAKCTRRARSGLYRRWQTKTMRYRPIVGASRRGFSIPGSRLSRARPAAVAPMPWLSIDSSRAGAVAGPAARCSGPAWPGFVILACQPCAGLDRQLHAGDGGGVACMRSAAQQQQIHQVGFVDVAQKFGGSRHRAPLLRCVRGPDSWRARSKAWRASLGGRRAGRSPAWLPIWSVDHI